MTAFRCIVCGSTSIQVFLDTWACKQCEQVYPVKHNIPLLVRDWAKHAATIDRAQQSLGNWYVDEQPPEKVSPWRHHLKKRRIYVESCLKRAFERANLSKFENALDLGCGDGNHLNYLNAYAHNLYGSDYNLLRLVRAQSRFPKATLFLADILDYPMVDDFFDLIFFNHVIEHIPDDVLALKTLYRILKPGGLLILGTPNEGAWWWQLAYKLQPEILQISDHVHFYTLDTLLTRIETAQFKIIETKRMGWGPPHWSLDGLIRRYKLFDDLFEFLGSHLIPGQASSLYVIATK